ncbi:MAG: bifunctional glutamate N-acetyltransferase/amino-acid acetyltransferase ArgJ [Betaproteobacteria bacterium]|nr:bifunctional glutamate N-acetyltransferase/amino-acid acetyltransferase ArgJ [Betaproteobacteria bacterium]
MAVNLNPPDPKSLREIRGVKLGYAEAGIRKAGRRDLMLMSLAPGSRVAGVFTRNSFAAAPVRVCREALAAADSMRALIVNAGNANCGTGEQGLAASRRTCEAVAAALGCKASEVLPFSTGVILEHLPVDRIEAALPRCVSSLGDANWADAAAAIMTTDTVPKAFSRTVEIAGRVVGVTGMAKGVGMLQPNMATMLAFIATDAAVSGDMLRRMVQDTADVSFNRVTVDGDTSTNDSFVLVATGGAGTPDIVSRAAPEYARLYAAVREVATLLAQAIARDGEGATKFITVDVAGAASVADAVAVARSVANSPLVKTAFFASDPNLGRLIMAVGNAGILELDTSMIDIHIGGVKVIDRGGRAATYREEDGAREMKQAEITVLISLGQGEGSATVWTCDYSYDYVKINAEYRT